MDMMGVVVVVVVVVVVLHKFDTYTGPTQARVQQRQRLVLKLLAPG